MRIQLRRQLERWQPARLSVVALFCWLILFPSSVEAYIDPNVGGYVFQIVAASLIFILVTIRRLWTRVLRLLAAPFRALTGRKD